MTARNNTNSNCFRGLCILLEEKGFLQVCIQEIRKEYFFLNRCCRLMYFDQGRRKGQAVTFIYYVRYFKGCLMYFPKWIEKS